MRRLTERSEAVSKLIPDDAAEKAFAWDLKQVKEKMWGLASNADDAVTTVFDEAIEKAHKDGIELTEALADDIMEAALEAVKQEFEIHVEMMVEELYSQLRKVGRPRVSFTEPDEGEKAEPHDFSLRWR